MADERQSEMSDLIDDEAFVDDSSSDAGTEEGSDIFSDGQDPFYDRSPWFILVGRLVTGTGVPISSVHRLGRDLGRMLAWLSVVNPKLHRCKAESNNGRGEMKTHECK